MSGQLCASYNDAVHEALELAQEVTHWHKELRLALKADKEAAVRAVVAAFPGAIVRTFGHMTQVWHPGKREGISFGKPGTFDTVCVTDGTLYWKAHSRKAGAVQLCTSIGAEALQAAKEAAPAVTLYQDFIKSIREPEYSFNPYEPKV